MAKYLRTSSISAELENLIREAKKEVYIISPYLKLSDRVKELLNDKEREKVEVRIVFGKQELAPAEMGYLEGLRYVRLYFSKNLHAKCYLNENKMIITSMNLYEFSQQNNKEMGILIDSSNEADKIIYDEAANDIGSIIHNSEDFSYRKVPQKKTPKEPIANKNKKEKKNYSSSKFKSTSALSKTLNVSSKDLFEFFEDNEWIERDGKHWVLTEAGKEMGGEMKKGQYGVYPAWPEEIVEEIKDEIELFFD